VPRREPYVPKHRGPRAEPSSNRLGNRLSTGLNTRLGTGLRTSLAVSGVAVAATGLAVSSGIALQGPGEPASAALAAHQVDTITEDSASSGSPADDLGDRAATVSRSVERTQVDHQKKRALDQGSGGQVTETEDLTGGDPRTVAKALLPQFGFGADQFSCLDSIYSQESGWNTHADNPSSSAYGIPQALPGSKMASAGPNWENDAATQIKWGLGYIKGRYGSPCSAWGFKQGHGWY
jgi:hypothetical protein